MAGDSYRSTVSDYVTLVRGITYKGSLVGEPGPALLGLGSIEPGGGFRVGKYKTYGGNCPDELMLYPGDIYASLKGATKDGKMIGSVARVPTSVPSGRLTQDTVKLVFREPNREDATYLYWVLRTPQYRDYCAGHSMGSAVVALRRSDFLAYPVPPPTTARRVLVALLDSIEDKIELNRRMSETLEEMARALFESWFVDFDPVRAKAEGRDPGLPKYLADLFPDSFEDSELGEIPKGWVVGRFGDVVTQLRDQENPISSPEALYHHFSLPAFDDGQSPKLEYGEDIKSQKSLVPAGTVLLSKLNPEIERVWVVDVRPADRAVCSTEFLVLRARPPFARSFIYCLARSPLFRRQIEGLVTGTSKSHQRAQVDSILNLAVVSPPSLIAAAFSSLADNHLARTLDCRREARTLAALRDTLLPKLISGDMRVSDAERLVREAT